jgi:heme-degrading monooxygenase HmoA
MEIARRNLIQVASASAAIAPILGAASAFAAPSPGASPKILELDDQVTFAQQLQYNVFPVVLMSTFLVAPEDVDAFLTGFKEQFAIMRKQPGLISAQLHRGIAGSCLFMNYVIWESVDAFNRGYHTPEFQAQLKEYPPSAVVSASMFQRVAIPGMCLGEPIGNAG